MIKPDRSIVAEARARDLSLVDHLHFDDKKSDWGFIANNFVLKHRNHDRKRVSAYIDNLPAQVSCIRPRSSQRKMRAELDQKVVSLNPSRLINVVGTNSAEKLLLLCKLINR